MTLFLIAASAIAAVPQLIAIVLFLWIMDSLAKRHNATPAVPPPRELLPEPVVEQISDRHDPAAAGTRYYENMIEELVSKPIVGEVEVEVIEEPVAPQPITSQAVIGESVEALVYLGYGKREAANSVDQVISASTEPKTVEQIVEAVLKMEGNGV